MSYSVYTGQAMTFLQGYATDAYNHSAAYLDALNNYVSEEINTTPPSISIDVNQSVVIDPVLAEAKPDPPEDSEYPSLPAEPSVSTFDFPTKPSYTLPTVPTLSDISIPEFIDGTIMTVSTSIPSMGFDVPSVSDISTTDAPLDSLFQTIKARLESNILNGGTMLDSSVEADIWNRDLERNEQALQDGIDKLTSQWAKLGFSVPDGLLAGSMIAINNEYTNKRNRGQAGGTGAGWSIQDHGDRCFT